MTDKPSQKPKSDTAVTRQSRQTGLFRHVLDAYDKRQLNIAPPHPQVLKDEPWVHIQMEMDQHCRDRSERRYSNVGITPNDARAVAAALVAVADYIDAQTGGAA